MSKISAYLAKLTALQRRRFAALARTSTTHLTNLAHEHSSIGIDLADRLERASLKLGATDPTAPAPLCRTQLHPVCRNCPLGRG